MNLVVLTVVVDALGVVVLFDLVAVVEVVFAAIDFVVVAVIGWAAAPTAVIKFREVRSFVG